MGFLSVAPALLFIILFLHQTTTAVPYDRQFIRLFIILFLHQTTTGDPVTFPARCCLSSCSYIKPQLIWIRFSKSTGLFIILFLHQTTTGNVDYDIAGKLFIILFLHQTTTQSVSWRTLSLLFIILFLHQTTTSSSHDISVHVLFIILFLHQTTTKSTVLLLVSCCLSSCSYIKPQLIVCPSGVTVVVYHLVPTSNHNWHLINNYCFQLFIILFLHQTTTRLHHKKPHSSCLSSCSYIKPQQRCVKNDIKQRCLSSCSYIKPQLNEVFGFMPICCLSSCSYIKPQLSVPVLSREDGCLSSCSYIKPQPLS